MDMSSFPTHFVAKMCYTFIPNVVFKDDSASNLVRQTAPLLIRGPVKILAHCSRFR